jgi:hypothetical protein
LKKYSSNRKKISVKNPDLWGYRYFEPKIGSKGRFWPENRNFISGQKCAFFYMLCAEVNDRKLSTAL